MLDKTFCTMLALVIKSTTEENLGISYSKKSLILQQKYLQFLYEENFSKMAILYSMVFECNETAKNFPRKMK